jgi:hypothetical protein
MEEGPRKAKLQRQLRWLGIRFADAGAPRAPLSGRPSYTDRLTEKSGDKSPHSKLMHPAAGICVKKGDMQERNRTFSKG